MKFNKPLLLWLVVMLAGCAANPDKPKKTAAEAAPKDLVNAASATTVSSSALPAGPVTPNPYLQNPQKFGEQIEVSFQDAVAAIQQKNWAHAEAVLVPLAEKNPALSGVQLNLGIVYRAKGDTEKAAAAFSRAIAANAKNVNAYNQLAVLKREAGDFAAAEALYQKALAVWPFYPEGHKNIAILYDLYLGKPETALPHYLAYQQLLGAPDKQLDSWIADLQRRLNGKKEANPPAENAEAK